MVLFPVCSYGQDSLATLKTVVHPIAIDPKNTDFTDLGPLGINLKTTKIVMLGEQHGDGSVILSKIRLVKYLHEHLGYNTIFFESSMFDCFKASYSFNNNKITTKEFFKQAILPHWSTLKELNYLYGYIDSCNQTTNRISIYGFDCQLSGVFSKYLFADFVAFAGKNKIIISDSSILNKTYQRLLTAPMLKSQSDSLIWQARYGQFDKRVTDIIRRIYALKTDTSELFLYKSAFAYLSYFTSGTNNKNKKEFSNYNSHRDSLMAGNFFHLLKTLPPGQKIIVWAATAHISSQGKASTYKTMGQYLDEGNINSYKIGFMHSTGNKLIIFSNDVKPIGKAIKYSPEWYLEKTAYEHLYIDIKTLTQQANTDMLIKNMFQNDRKQVLSRHQGIIYIKKLVAAQPEQP